MDLTHYTDGLADDLRAAAALGDDNAQRTAAALAAALEPAARLMLMAALSDVAAEVTAALGDRVVEVRLDGREVRVVADEQHSAPPVAPASSAPRPRMFEDINGDISRVTLRMVEQLKAKAEQAANHDGVSLNAWLSQAVQGALRDAGALDARSATGASKLLRGWVQG